MKLSVVLSILGLAVIAGGLVATNPQPDEYVQYAQQQSEQYLNEEVCNELPPHIGELLAGQCPELVKTLEPQLESLIRDRTERLNLGIASIYRTSFEIPGVAFVPQYQVESLGILGKFFTYRAEQVQ